MLDTNAVRENFLVAVRGLQVDHVVQQEVDGSFSVIKGSTRARVQVVLGQPDSVQITAEVLLDLPLTVELLGTLNRVNATSRFCRAFWENDSVMLRSELIAGLMTSAELEFQLRNMSGLADELDDYLQQRYGGRRALDPTASGTMPAIPAPPPVSRGTIGLSGPLPGQH